MLEIQADLNSLDKVTSQLKSMIKSHTIILLNGDLSSGKTTLSSKLINKYEKHTVTSPTFSICVKYSEYIYHYDMYNKSLDEFISLGLLEQLDNKALHIIEWADKELKKILDEYGFYTINIDIVEEMKENRLYRIY